MLSLVPFEFINPNLGVGGFDLNLPPAIGKFASFPDSTNFEVLTRFHKG